VPAARCSEPEAARARPARARVRPSAWAARSTDSQSRRRARRHVGAYWQGEGTLRVPMTLHAKNRSRLLDEFDAADVPPNSFIMLQGGMPACSPACLPAGRPSLLFLLPPPSACCPSSQHPNRAQSSRALSGTGEEQALYDTDRELLFRQESYFQWAFGVAEPGFFGAMDVTRRRSVLFMPRLPPEYAVWMGVIHSPQYFQRKYEVDEVLYTDQLDEFMARTDPAVLYTLKGLNSDSGNTASEAAFDGMDKYRVDNGRLFPIIANLRVSQPPASWSCAVTAVCARPVVVFAKPQPACCAVWVCCWPRAFDLMHYEFSSCALQVIKTEEEIEVLRYVAAASSAAHKAVMRKMRPGTKEYQAEATFKNEVSISRAREA
jgi:hypothetical protein